MATEQIADMNETIESFGKDRPLRDDIRLLGRILGNTVREQEGEAVFDIVERIRQTSIRFHRDNDEAARHALEATAGPASESPTSDSRNAAGLSRDAISLDSPRFPVIGISPLVAFSMHSHFFDHSFDHLMLDPPLAVVVISYFFGSSTWSPLSPPAAAPLK